MDFFLYYLDCLDLLLDEEGFLIEVWFVVVGGIELLHPSAVEAEAVEPFHYLVVFFGVDSAAEFTGESNAVGWIVLGHE